MLMMAARKKKEDKEEESKKNKDLHYYIVETLGKLVKPDMLKNSYSREYKIFKKLMAKYPDKRIWNNIKFQVNSLAFYLTPKGIGEVEKIINSLNYIIKENEVVELTKEKIGPDLYTGKVLSLKEFLNKYK
jgi:ribosomal protein S4E